MKKRFKSFSIILLILLAIGIISSYLLLEYVQSSGGGIKSLGFLIIILAYFIAGILIILRNKAGPILAAIPSIILVIAILYLYNLISFFALIILIIFSFLEWKRLTSSSENESYKIVLIVFIGITVLFSLFNIIQVLIGMFTGYHNPTVPETWRIVTIFYSGFFILIYLVSLFFIIKKNKVGAIMAGLVSIISFVIADMFSLLSSLLGMILILANALIPLLAYLELRYLLKKED